MQRLDNYENKYIQVNHSEFKLLLLKRRRKKK